MLLIVLNSKPLEKLTPKCNFSQLVCVFHLAARPPNSFPINSSRESRLHIFRLVSPLRHLLANRVAGIAGRTLRLASGMAVSNRRRLCARVV
jgi:hypothetical protein